MIIAAHNELANLQKHLPQILEQNYVDFEVVVALDRCTDGSWEYLQFLADPRLRVLNLPEVPVGFHGKKYALKQAIAVAQNEWLLLTDADCWPISAHWIDTFANAATPDVHILLGLSPYHLSSKWPGWLVAYETLHTALRYGAAALAGKPYMAVGRNLAYRKSLFIQCGGFGPTAHVTGGDDDLLIQRMTRQGKVRLVWEAKGQTYSEAPRSWSQYLRQKIRHQSVGRHYSPFLQWTQSVFAGVHLLLWGSFLYLGLSGAVGVAWLLPALSVLTAKTLIFKLMAHKIRFPFSLTWFVVCDFLYATGWPLLAVRSIFVKKIQWK